MSVFRFKQFAIKQANVPMKVNTDGVLLGAWTDVSNATKILDIGSGTGVIALMLAQRCPNATIHAVEIDKMAVETAKENVRDSPWVSRVEVFGSSFQDFAGETDQRYNLVVSNPPFFIQSLKSPFASRNLSRHADQLSYDDLVIGINRVLEDNGIFAAIFPYAEAGIFIALAANHGLYCIRKSYVHPFAGGRIKRVLLELSRTRGALVESDLAIRVGPNLDYTEDYKRITCDFYLAF
ncbi:tRNA1(Val) (adenine(37)-N6)-methyltransferase [Williamwhitmania taraxaci]|uniref:tRNA1(Val) (adenine(37)-N6)-methyltransferase n=1 Tax=Williamwhitmania taraxaci TaxID=1640674 RepID=A0A1G6S8Q6_9BACT|nr:methyltransferase [Williamwhitmania taraxaci]SDD12497.1 tRNA1Val (adenine37-N6)-methyltransferase [Williamwhitmania taraxaci]